MLTCVHSNSSSNTFAALSKCDLISQCHKTVSPLGSSYCMQQYFHLRCQTEREANSTLIHIGAIVFSIEMSNGKRSTFYSNLYWGNNIFI